MKRSKILLGALTAVLAVAGATAAKHYGPSTRRYYVTSFGAWCLSVNATCTNTGTTPCMFNGAQLYTLGPAGVYNPFNPTNCITPVRYKFEP